MIILPVSNLENKKLKRNIDINFPSSVLKSKHLERSKIHYKKALSEVEDREKKLEK